MKHPTEQEFRELLQTEQRPVIVDFFASWCGPCKMFAPVFNETADKLGKDFCFVMLDVDDCDALCSELKIETVPTILVFENSQVTKRKAGGFPSAKEFEKWLL